MNQFEKIAAKAYDEEMEILWKLAEADGIIDPDFTSEKRAAYRELVDMLDREELDYIGKLAWADLEPIEKIAIASGRGSIYAQTVKTAGIVDALVRGGGRVIGGLGKALGGAGKLMGAGATAAEGVGARVLGKGEQMAGASMANQAKFLASRGHSPEMVDKAMGQIRTLGPMGYVRQQGWERSRAKSLATRMQGAAEAIHGGDDNILGNFPSRKGAPGASTIGSTVMNAAKPAPAYSANAGPGWGGKAWSGAAGPSPEQAAAAVGGDAFPTAGPARAGRRAPKGKAMGGDPFTSKRGPTPEQAMRAAKGHSPWADLRQGAYFGAGLGLLQRETAPKEQPEIQFAN